MKRTLIYLLFAIPAMVNISAQSEKEYSSNLKKVVLFPYEAQEYRTANVQLEKDKQVIKLTGLSPYIKKESVRVESDGSFTILNVNYELDYLNKTEKSEKAKALDAKIKEVNYKIQDVTTEIAIVRQKIEYFEANRYLTKENKLSPADFKLLTDFYMKQMEDARIEGLGFERKLKVYNDSLTAYRNQLNQINSLKSEPSGVITVVLIAKSARAAKLNLSYIVERASWSPSYDIRFESINKPLKLSYKATIQQSTGIDWNNIGLSLSTAQTQLSADAPVLNPYYLQYVFVQDKPKQISLQASASNSYAPAPKARTDYKKAAPTPGVQQGTSFTFNVDGEQTLKSEAKENLLRFKDAEVPCTYTYKTIPKLSDKVYLIGRITDWYEMGIQNGDLNLYFENAFIGTSYIDTEQFSDTLDVSFGVDQGISVKREKIKDFSSKKIFGDKKEDYVGWKIIIRNNKNEVVKVKVLDQLPITKNEDFEVEVDNISGAKQNETSGELEWNISLNPKETKEIILQYIVKYPKGMQLVTD